MRSVAIKSMLAVARHCTRVLALMTATVAVAVSAEPTSAPALRATFEWQRGDQIKQMVLLRQGNRVERSSADEPIRVWRNDADGIALTEFDLDREQAIEFSPGELRARNIVVSWDALSHVIDPALRSVLKERAVWPRGKYYRQRFRGEIHQQQVSLTWLRDLDLPETVQWRHGNETTALRLVSVEVTDAPPFSHCEGCSTIDVADLEEGPRRAGEGHLHGDQDRQHLGR